MVHRPRIPDPVFERAAELKEEQDYPSVGEAIRAMCRDGGYEV